MNRLIEYNPKQSISTTLVLLLGILIGIAACKNHGSSTADQDNNNNAVYQSDPALIAITSDIKSHPDNAELYYKRGNLLHKQKEDTLALRDYKKAIALDSTKSGYYSAVGDLYFENKDITGSLPWIQKAIALDPKDIKAHLKICKVLLYTSKYEEAIAEANKVLRQDVYNPEAYFLKGMVYKISKDTAHAIGNFETAVQVAPDYKDAILQLGLIYSSKKNPLALQYFQSAYKLDSTDMLPIFAMGVYYQNNGQKEMAKQLYHTCIVKNLRYVDAYFNMGLILMEQDSVEKALRQYDIVTQIDRMNPTAYYDRGVCYEHLKKIQEAIIEYKQAAQLDSTYASPKEALKRLNAK